MAAACRERTYFVSEPLSSSPDLTVTVDVPTPRSLVLNNPPGQSKPDAQNYESQISATNQTEHRRYTVEPIITPASAPNFVPIPPEPDIPPPPDRDLQDLAKRLVDGYFKSESIPDADPLVIGQSLEFWVSRDRGSVLVSGEVAHISEHAYWIFENGFMPNPSDIQLVAENFENDVWPSVTSVFGRPVSPGIDGDDRIVIYNAVLRAGAGGYFSAADSYPSAINPFSNQREALYISANHINLTSTDYLDTLAHELQHATHFAADPSEDTWVNEGLSEIAAELAGFVRSATSAFMEEPSTSLTDWPQDITVSAANYGAANLFFEFLSAHYGGYEMLRVVAQNEEDGLASIDSSLTQLGFDVTADDVFADWLIANYLSAEQGAYSYKKLTDTPIKNLYKQAPSSISHDIQAFGADYYVTSTESDRINIVFTGEPETSLIGVPAHSGKTCWWTNHGDSIDSKLTRVIDLTSVDSATLRYWTFYDIEEFWDYAYVMVSTDEGATWDILSTNSTTDLDPNGNAYGSGLTGATAGWVQDFVDLSDYAGKELLLRFEYITDDAVSSKGACFDDFEIPEINWSDDSSNIGGWISDGFVLAEKSVPTQYLIQVIHEKNIGEPVVYQIPVDSTAVGSLTVKGVGKDDFIIMIISAVNRHSTIPTDYTLSIST